MEHVFYSMRANVVARLSEYAGCSEVSAGKMINLITPLFSCEGTTLHNVSDRLDAKGY